MRIFLSYASQDRAQVEPVRYSLEEQGHDVFFDREDLPAGDAFDSRIRKAIERCELFICFLTPNTVDAGSYTLTELEILERVWPKPAGHVLPVVLRPVPMEQIPAYLKSVTLLQPDGNMTATVADATHQIARMRNRARMRRLGLAALALIVVALPAWYWLTHRSAVTTKDGAPVVPIEAGVFTMGDDENSPQREVYVSRFYIDRFEITTARYAEFMKANGSLAAPDEWERVKLPAQGELPVIGVSWRDAVAYCRWAGRRLPTESEWEKAARDSDARTYPWGKDEPSPERATYAGSAEDAYEGGLTPVGAHATGRSREGVDDLAGNVYEWVNDRFSESFPHDDVRDPAGPETGDGRVLRGSGWHDPAQRLDAARRYHATEDNRADDIGFRCAMDAKQ